MADARGDGADPSLLFAVTYQVADRDLVTLEKLLALGRCRVGCLAAVAGSGGRPSPEARAGLLEYSTRLVPLLASVLAPKAPVVMRPESFELPGVKWWPTTPAYPAVVTNQLRVECYFWLAAACTAAVSADPATPLLVTHLRQCVALWTRYKGLLFRRWDDVQAVRAVARHYGTEELLACLRENLCAAHDLAVISAWLPGIKEKPEQAKIGFGFLARAYERRAFFTADLQHNLRRVYATFYVESHGVEAAIPDSPDEQLRVKEWIARVVVGARSTELEDHLKLIKRAPIPAATVPAVVNTVFNSSGAPEQTPFTSVLVDEQLAAGAAGLIPIVPASLRLALAGQEAADGDAADDPTSRTFPPHPRSPRHPPPPPAAALRSARYSAGTARGGRRHVLDA